jgi:hypothetical protein
MLAEILFPEYLYKDKLVCELQAHGIPTSDLTGPALLSVFRTSDEEQINVRICMNTSFLNELTEVVSSAPTGSQYQSDAPSH